MYILYYIYYIYMYILYILYIYIYILYIYNISTQYSGIQWLTSFVNKTIYRTHELPKPINRFMQNK